jgi:Protein of unknown function (DUF1549)/Protein of unknown function (DUF1553)
MHRKQIAMTDRSDDPILDACLDEVLGDQLPPDLTARILHQLDSNGKPTESIRESSSGPTDVSRAARNVVSPRSSRHTNLTQRESSPWLAIAVSITIVGLGAAFVLVAWNNDDNQIGNASPLASSDTSLHPLDVPPPTPRDVVTRAVPDSVDESIATTSPPVATPLPLPLLPTSSADEADEVIATVEIPDERPILLADDQIVRSINELIRNRWQRESITPSEPIDDEQWCRRVFVKLIGREPSSEELVAFSARRSLKKREELVALLLDGENFVEEFASHWSKRWADILIASSYRGIASDDRRASREGLEQFLRRAFSQGRPFDETVSQLLTATGSGRIGSEDYNGATNFLLAHADRKGIHDKATTHVSRTFMAQSLECSQCHVDGTWSGIEQQPFWELNAFFRQLQVTEHAGSFALTNVDFGGEGSTPAAAEIYYYLPNGLLKAAYPVFASETPIPSNGKIALVDRRELLAKFVTRSEPFRQAMANRFWAELFGVGFTIPADNIGPHNPPSHPKLLAKLGGQLAAHDYDVRALLRWIVLSEAFALESGDFATQDQLHTHLTFETFPQQELVRSPVLVQLQAARQAYASFTKQAGNAATPARLDPTKSPGDASKKLSDIDELLAVVATEATKLRGTTVYGNNILSSEMSVEQKVQHMFFATLHRAPTKSEQKAVDAVLADNHGHPDATALEYIWWALATSQEAR